MANNTDALLTPSMPHSPQAEQAVLGSMLIDADCVKDVMDKLQAQDFYLRTNREIFETIYHMFVYSQPIDGVTVAGELEKNGLYNDNTRSYLLQLMEVTPTSANVMEYVRIEQDADIVMFLYRDDYYNSDAEKRNVAECIVAKNRHGETGKVELRWMPEYTAFGTLETRYDEDE